MQFQLSSVVSHPRASSSSNTVAKYVFSSRYPRLISAAQNLLVDHAIATTATSTTLRTPSKVDKIAYVGGTSPPSFLAFLEDGQVAIYHDTPTGLILANITRISNTNDNSHRPVSFVDASAYGSFSVFCKSDSPSIWCLPLVSSNSSSQQQKQLKPFKLRSDLGGDQQNATVIDGTVAKIRGKVATKSKMRHSPVISLASHPSLPFVAAAYVNGLIRVWDVERRDQRTHLDTQLLMAESIVSIKFHPQYPVIIACTTHGRIISFHISSSVYKYGDEPALATSKTRDRKRRFLDMCFTTHTTPPYLLLLTASKRLVVKLINRKGVILQSARFAKASRPLSIQSSTGSTADNQSSAFARLQEYEQENNVQSGRDIFPASIAADPTFGLLACSLDRSGNVYVFQPFIDNIPTLRVPLSPGLDYPLLSSSFNKAVANTEDGLQLLGDIDVSAESLFVYSGTLFSYTLGTERVSKLSRLPGGDVISMDVARDEHGYCIAALIFYHGDDLVESTEYVETQEIMRYVISTRRGETDYWNTSEPSEGRAGCFLGPPGKHDRVLIISASGLTVSISSFSSSAPGQQQQQQRAVRGVQRFKLAAGRVGRVFRAPFAQWSSVLYHDVREKRVTASKNTFENASMNYDTSAARQDMNMLYSMDNSTSFQLQNDESVLDVRWQLLSNPRKGQDDDYLGAIMTNKRIYFIRHVLQALSKFEFQSMSRIIVPFGLPSIVWAGASLMLLYGNSLFAVSVDGTYDFIAGLSHGESATTVIACLPDRLIYASPSFSSGKVTSVCVRSRPYGGLSPVTKGILSLPQERHMDGRFYAPIVNSIFERHDVSQGSLQTAETIKNRGVAAVAYLMAVSKQGKHSLPPLKRAIFLSHMGDIRGALAVAENEYTKLESGEFFHVGTELYRLLQRILNMAFIIGDFEVCRRCSQLIGRRGTLSAFVESEGGYEALQAVMETIRKSRGGQTVNTVDIEKLKLLLERSGNSSISSQIGVMPSRRQVQILRHAIASGGANQASFGSVDVRGIFIHVVIPQQKESGKRTLPLVNRVQLENRVPKSTGERLEILTDESAAFDADIPTATAEEYAEFVEDGPRLEPLQITGPYADNGGAVAGIVDSSDDDDDNDDDNFVGTGKGNEGAEGIEGLLPARSGDLSKATAEGAIDTESKIEKQRDDSRLAVQQVTQSTKQLAAAQRLVTPTGAALPEVKATELLTRASEKFQEERIKSAQKDVENGIRALARGVQRGINVSPKLLTQLVHYRFACKLRLAMSEILESGHAGTVAGRMTYAQFATACTTLSLQDVDSIDALVRAVDGNLALGNFGIAAQGLKLIKERGVPDGMREDLRKRYDACQVSGYVNSVVIPSKLICYSSLRAVILGVHMAGCSVCPAIYSAESDVVVNGVCEYCQMGKILSR